MTIAKLQEPVTKAIEERARTGRLITYSELAGSLPGHYVDPHDPRFHALLGEISSTCHRHGDPMLTALVVLKDTGLPGDGFFKLATSLGHPSMKNDTQRLQFWSAQVAAIQLQYGYQSPQARAANA